MKWEHPRGLIMLFFAEMWERFSFYGMRAILVLYMVNDLFDKVANNEEIAYGIYAAYGALVYATPTIGGRIADQILGYRKAIMLGGILMALGHFIMAFENDYTFYSALALLIIGNGFFKPNISTMVGGLYEDGDPRRDSGFTIFYMGVNLGAFLSPLACGWLGESYGWHYGFSLAGFGMVAGLLVFWSAIKKNVFKENGQQPLKYKDKKFFGVKIDILIYVASFLAIPLFALAMRFNDLQILGWDLMGLILTVILAFVIVYVIYLSFTEFEKVQIQRIVVMFVFLLFNMIFWSFFEQAGSSLVLFAEKNVDLKFLLASQTNSINPFFIIIFAIPFSFMWLKLSSIKRNPNSPVKFSMGLAQLGIGFLLFAVSARFMNAEARVPMFFLIFGWLLITTGELVLSPIGLSKVTELVPKKLTALMMGTYFLSTAFSHHIAGQIAKLTTVAANKAGQRTILDTLTEKVTGLSSLSIDGALEGVQTLTAYTSVFGKIGFVAIGFGFIALLLSPWLKKWMHGVN